MQHLDSLGAISTNPLGKSPALLLERLVLLELDAVLGDDGDAVLVQAPRIAVVQHLHALLDHLDGLLLGELCRVLLGGGIPPHDGLGERRAESCGQAGRGEAGAAQVDAGQVGLGLVVQAGDQQLVPERVEVAAPAVHELLEVLVQVGGVEDSRGGRVVVGLVDGELVEVSVEELHVADVAAEADHRGLVEDAQALDVGEAGEGAVGCFAKKGVLGHV